MRSFFWPIALFTIAAFISCKKAPETKEEGVLLRYAGRSLTVEEVERMMPEGISSTDSVALFNAIVEGWLKDEVLSDFAEERLYDTDAIDRKVSDYRNSLIVQEYLSRMQESKTPKIEEKKVKDYYELHSKDMKLEVPLVKGVFLKFSNGIADRETLRKLLSDDDPKNIDILEQDWIERSLEYNYFRDKWIDWETLSGMIPYRFGDPDKFLKENTFFETEYGDCVYYLQITDHILSGDTQPYEYAKTWISNILTQGALADYERKLVNSLIEKAEKDRKLEAVGYDLKNRKEKI